MTAINNSNVKLPAPPASTSTASTTTAPPTPGPVVELVRQAALDLLASLPVRPERLRVSAADVTVDLDWRTRPLSGTAAGTEAPAPAPTNGAPAAAEPDNAPSNGVRLDLHYVCAPTVGTFYRAPEPGATPFVSEGATITPGQQVGLIEAMKLFLPVEADRGGRVVEVLVADGQSVEYGEPLLALAPADAD